MREQVGVSAAMLTWNGDVLPQLGPHPLAGSRCCLPDLSREGEQLQRPGTGPTHSSRAAEWSNHG